MATQQMVLATTEKNTYEPNILSKQATFDNYPSLINSTPLVGTVSTNNQIKYDGQKSLQIYYNENGEDLNFEFENNDLQFQCTKAGLYIFRVEFFKKETDFIPDFKVLVTEDGVATDERTYIANLDVDFVDGFWNTYYFVVNCLFNKTYNFVFSTRSDTNNRTIYVDGLKLSYYDRKSGDLRPSIYTPPQTIINEIQIQIQINELVSQASQIITILMPGAKLLDYCSISLPVNLATSGLTFEQPYADNSSFFRFKVKNNTASTINTISGVINAKSTR